jgi:hypothetical protein
MQETYEQMRQDIVDFLMSGEIHSSLVGRIVLLQGKEDDRKEVENYAEYIVNLVQRSKLFKKGDVKNS